jgi:anti-sigma B factor antagonist
VNDDLVITVDVDDDSVLVSVRGEIDRANAHELEQRLNDATRASVPRIVDLTEVTFIDSGGLRALQMSAQRAPLRIVLPEGARIARTLKIAGIHELIPIFATVAEAKEL